MFSTYSTEFLSLRPVSVCHSARYFSETLLSSHLLLCTSMCYESYCRKLQYSLISETFVLSLGRTIVVSRTPIVFVCGA